MAQLANIEAIEKKLWNASDTLRSNYSRYDPGMRMRMGAGEALSKI